MTPPPGGCLATGNDELGESIARGGQLLQPPFDPETAEAVADAIGAHRVGIRLSPGGTIWDVTEDDVQPLARHRRCAGRTQGRTALAGPRCRPGSFGRAFLGNPDLVERMRTGAPLREFDSDALYGGGDTGYIAQRPLDHRQAGKAA